MKQYVNGEYFEMTAEDAAVREKENLLANIEELRRPLTAEKVGVLLITQQINTLEVDDNTALRMVHFYPDWTPGISYGTGHKVQYGGGLWRCLSGHTSAVTWEPSAATASLWERVCENHGGTVDDPVPYGGNMTLETGKYYYQNHRVYLCIRDTGNPVCHDLRDLVGIYVEAVC